MGDREQKPGPGLNSGWDPGLLGLRGSQLSHLHNGDKNPRLSGMLTRLSETVGTQ